VHTGGGVVSELYIWPCLGCPCVFTKPYREVFTTRKWPESGNSTDLTPQHLW
jgi:hypothetical protein